MTRTVRKAVFGLGLSMLCLPSTGRAEPFLGPALHWTRSADATACIDPAALASRVEQLTGPVLRRPSGALRILEGHIERSPAGGYRARLTVANGDGRPAGERVLQHASEDCRAFDPALSFVLAIMIDPNLSLDALPPELLAFLSGEELPEEQLKRELEQQQLPRRVDDAAIPSSEAPQADASSAKPEDEKPEIVARPRNFALVLAGLAEFSVMPERLVGLSASFVWEATRSLSVMGSLRGAAHLMLVDLELPFPAAGRGSAIDAHLAVCAGTEPEPAVRLKVCLGPEYSLWRLMSGEFSNARAARLHGLGANLSMELRYRLSARFALVASGAVRVNAMLARFTYDAGATALEVPRFSLLTAFGPSYAF